MSQAKASEQTIRSILVALDGSPASLAALDAAIELAASLEAELVGLFVEDINLLRLTELSFVQEVGLFSATSRRLEIRHVERQFRSLSSRVHRTLARLAEQAGVNWSFRVVRGVITAELLAAAAETDLIILGRKGWFPAGKRRLGSTTRAILAQGVPITLILQPGFHLGLPILVIYDSSDTAQRALAAAAQLGQGQAESLTVLILAAGPEKGEQLQQQATALLDRYGVQARYLRQTESTAQRLTRTAQTEGCRLLVLPSHGSLMDYEALLTLLGQIDCPVLLVR